MRLEPLRRLRYLRQRRSLSLRELAALSGVSAATISRLEAQKVYAIPRTARRLAEALGVTPDQLYASSEDESPPPSFSSG